MQPAAWDFHLAEVHFGGQYTLKWPIFPNHLIFVMSLLTLYLLQAEIAQKQKQVSATGNI